MAKHFAITISSKPRHTVDGTPIRPSLGYRLKNAALAFVVLVFVAAAIIVGSMLGAAIGMAVGALVLVALMVLLVRGILDRGRNKSL